MKLERDVYIAWFQLRVNMKYDELIFENDGLFHDFSRWKRPKLMLFQVHYELTSSNFMKSRKPNIKTF